MIWMDRHTDAAVDRLVSFRRVTGTAAVRKERALPGD